MTDAPCKHQAEAHHLRAGIKLLADTVRSWGWVSRRQESNGEIVGRALHEMQSRIELLESVAPANRVEIGTTNTVRGSFIAVNETFAAARRDRAALK